ncbi:histidine kinase [Ruminococcaceae bacterium OttesenSCG-928-L11]|nr:histidine kinase [Ruminococcaceae bacterium OttesenSCG-928-L11]
MEQIRSSIQAKLTLLFLCGALIPVILLSALVTYSSHQTIMEKELAYVNDKMETVNASLNMTLTEMERSLAGLLSSDTLRGVLSSRPQSASLEWYYQYKEIERLLRTVASSNANVTFTVIGEDNRVYNGGNFFNRSERIDGPLCRQIIENPWHVTLARRSLRGYLRTPVLTMGKGLSEQGELLGILLADLELSYLDGMLEVFGPDVSIYMLDGDSEPLYVRAGSIDYEVLAAQMAPEQLLSGETLRLEGREYLCIRGASADYAVESVLLIPMDEVYRDSNQNLFRTIVILIVILVQTALFARVFASEFTRRIRGLNREVADFAARGGTESIHMRAPNPDEFGQLARGVTVMSERIVEMMGTIRRDEEEKRRLEIAALQSQINPHMLYNTLNTITRLAQLQGVRNIEEVSAAFAQMMRIISKASGDRIPLEQELDYIRRYVAIKKYQIVCNLDVEIRMDESLSKRLVLKLLLQPFVENAIVHGFATTTTAARLVIAIRDENGYMHVQIEDNGAGMDDATKKRVLSGWKKEGESFTSVGIHNTLSRLRLQYKDDCRFDIRDRLDGGTVISMAFPSEERGEEAET